MSRTKHHRAKNKDMQTVPADYRKHLNTKAKSQVKQAMKHEQYDNIPTFKQDALYHYL